MKSETKKGQVTMNLTACQPNEIGREKVRADP
jgi:hypothetical protein